jgi:hypothetical protein
MISDWKRNNLKESDFEFAKHVQTQLAFEKESLLKLKIAVPDETDDEKSIAEEKINMLEELMTPLRDSVFAASENIYTPTCIGVISRWPWYNLLKDWLCLVQREIILADYETFPFERYVFIFIGA